MLTSRVMAIALATFSMQSEAATTWIKAGTGSNAVCGGIRDTCSGVEQCTWHAMGGCGGLAQPNSYIAGSITGVALIKSATLYLTDEANQASVLTPSSVAENGYREMSDSATDGTATYAFIRAGAFFGSNPTQAGVFAGMGAYICKSGTISTNMMSLNIPTTIGSSTVSAKQVCISPVTSGACGAARTFNTGDYKFSMFGYTTGDNLAAEVNTYSYFGIRTQMTISGTTADLTINAGKTLSNIGSDDVTKIRLQETGGQRRLMTIDFPTQYNVGDTTTAGLMAPTETKNVKIKIKAVPGQTNAIYVDYIFDIINVKDKYFIYDPTVKDSKGPDAGSASNANEVAILFPLVVTFASALLLL